jgi:hypothetical protein
VSVSALFPVTDGILVSGLRAGLAAAALSYSSGVYVARKLPDARTARMVTVRNDSGPEDATQSRRRYGFNVWADDSVDAEKLALLAMAVLRKLPDGQPITAVDSLSGPFEIEDDPQQVVGGKNLTHFYFTARVSVRGSSF